MFLTESSSLRPGGKIDVRSVWDSVANFSFLDAGVGKFLPKCVEKWKALEETLVRSKEEETGVE